MLPKDIIIENLRVDLGAYNREFGLENLARIENLRGWIEGLFFVLGEDTPGDLIAWWEQSPKKQVYQ